MESLRILFLCLCCVVLLVGSSQAQQRGAKKSDDWTPKEPGCSRFVVERGLPEPKDLVDIFYYLSYRLRGKHTVKGYEYNCLPVVRELNLSESELTMCSQNPALCSQKSPLIEISAHATDADGDQLIYQYRVTAGQITGTGAKVVWDLSGVQPGVYQITFSADDGCGYCGATLTKEIRIVECGDCVGWLPPPSCPTGFAVTADKKSVEAGETVTFTARADFPPEIAAESVVYHWTISGGEIISGEGANKLTVKAVGTAGKIEAFFTLGRLDPDCCAFASASVEVLKP